MAKSPFFLFDSLSYTYVIIEHVMNDKSGEMEVRAVRRIKQGEEITLTYIGATCRDRDERRKFLQVTLI